MSKIPILSLYYPHMSKISLLPIYYPHLPKISLFSFSFRVLLSPHSPSPHLPKISLFSCSFRALLSPHSPPPLQSYHHLVMYSFSLLKTPPSPHLTRHPISSPLANTTSLCQTSSSLYSWATQEFSAHLVYSIIYWYLSISIHVLMTTF